MSEDKNKDLNRLAKAKLALSGEQAKESWQKDAEYLTKRKEEAIKALASQEQTKALEQLAKERATKLETQKKLAELEELRKKSEEEKKKALAEEQARKDAEAEAERQRKIIQIIEAEKEIDFIKKSENTGPQPIKTLTRDAGLAIKKGQLTASQIIQNKNKATQNNLAQLKTKKNYSWLIGLGVLIIIIGSIITIIAFNQRRVNSLATIEKTRTSLIFVDNQVAINLNDKTNSEILTEIKKEAEENLGTKESLIELYFVKNIEKDSEKGLEIILTEASLLVSLRDSGLNIPDNFSRFLEAKGLLGLHQGTTNEPFYILKTNNYKNVANALLEEEKEIITELLKPFLNTNALEEINGLNFQDKMINNYDTRIILNNFNQTIALYAWFDDKTLIITTNESTFRKILDTLQNPR